MFYKLAYKFLAIRRGVRALLRGSVFDSNREYDYLHNACNGDVEESGTASGICLYNSHTFTSLLHRKVMTSLIFPQKDKSLIQGYLLEY